MPSPSTAPRPDPRGRLLLLSVLVVATCGLVYELIAATMASYLLGDSVTQFSLVIGVYLSAMGLGSWLSKSVERQLHTRFIQVQLIIAVVGGVSAPALFLGFAHLEAIRPLLYGILVVVGTMVGLEIPLLMRILKEGHSLRELVARVLAFDYLGALAASLLFPLALLPYLGLVRTSLLFGVFNGVVALWCARAFRSETARPGWLQAQAAVVVTALGGGLIMGDRIETFGEDQLFEAPVIMSQKTPYQRITLTRWRDDLRLFLDGNLQFSSLDEHRYHEALVHPAMAAASARSRVLILGGGDGLALREVLKHPEVERVDLVDLDPAMTTMFSEQPMLAALNRGSLEDERVTIHNADALTWLEDARQSRTTPHDVVIVDLPDPNNFSLGKLYTRAFYRLLATRVAKDGAAVIQSTSPYLAPRSFWCITRTIGSAGLAALPYHAHVPSFGDWGFVLATHEERAPPRELRPVPMRFLDSSLLPTLFVFPRDQRPPDVDINRLNDQLLVHYYEQDLVEPIPSLRRG